MKTFLLKKRSSVSRDELFQISTDIENFATIMPDYFKSLSIVEDSLKEKLVDEKISFLGKTVDVRTRHVIVHPNIHEVYILSGPLNGTSFIEHYDESPNGTDVTITISLSLNRFIPFLQKIIVNRMEYVFTAFLISVEEFLKPSA